VSRGALRNCAHGDRDLAHAAGAVDVVVTNPGGWGGTLARGFSYSVEAPYTVATSTDTVDAGGDISVRWTAQGARAGDWIVLFKVGKSHEDDGTVSRLVRRPTVR
jgi:hypothetical protein